MRTAKFKSIQNKLFITYSILVVTILLVFSLVFYFYLANILTKKALESMHQSSVYISNRLDSMVTDLNNISVKLIHSNSIRDLFFKDQDVTETSVPLITQRQINNVIYSVMGPLQVGWQINIFDQNGRFIAIGDYSYVTNIPQEKLSTMDWISETYKLDGNKYISAPHADDWAPYKKTVISLSRVFGWDVGSKRNAIVEVQLNYQTIEQFIGELMEEQTDKKMVYIYNERGELIYPYEEQAINSDSLYWNDVKDLSELSGYFHTKNIINNKNELLAYTRSTSTGWTIVSVQAESSLLQPVTSLRKIMVLVVIGILLLTLTVSFFVSRTLTLPIKRIHRSIRSMSLVAPASYTLETKSEVNELEGLEISFSRMLVRLQNSMEETLSSRSEEMQARLVALQSQMNPHFLYNTLTTISIIAEDNGLEKITKICDDLSGMLRYILTRNTEQVTIADEISYTENYISLMKIRYEEDLKYSMDVDPEIMKCYLPKLVIQPIVENCLKYGIHGPSPWNIELVGRKADDHWTIQIKDDGDGFPEEVLQSLRDFEPIMYMKQSQDEIDGKRKGMGLENIVARLHLLFGKEVIFQAFNHPEGGACVIIGGPLSRPKDIINEAGGASHERYV